MWQKTYTLKTKIFVKEIKDDINKMKDIPCSLIGRIIAEYGISQVRILEWAVISFFKGSSQPRD